MRRKTKRRARHHGDESRTNYMTSVTSAPANGGAAGNLMLPIRQRAFIKRDLAACPIADPGIVTFSGFALGALLPVARMIEMLETAGIECRLREIQCEEDSTAGAPAACTPAPPPASLAPWPRRVFGRTRHIWAKGRPVPRR